jgi:sirohydrochlorin ferrochelatase
MWGLKSVREITKVMAAEASSPEGFLVRFTVLLSIDLPASPTVETVEPLIIEAGYHVMRAALRQVALAAQAHVQVEECGWNCSTRHGIRRP